jgi:hypothetical protein
VRGVLLCPDRERAARERRRRIEPEAAALVRRDAEVDRAREVEHLRELRADVGRRLERDERARERQAVRADDDAGEREARRDDDPALLARARVDRDAGEQRRPARIERDEAAISAMPPSTNIGIMPKIAAKRKNKNRRGSCHPRGGPYP